MSGGKAVDGGWMCAILTVMWDFGWYVYMVSMSLEMLENVYSLVVAMNVDMWVGIL